ncbi:hypothetical protein ACFYXS_19255 [Streptomyces sp. NPDC002574]|uniref:hypothetical protein n=1 Tax=Streptomyces sp. NPDC002574 TaxID=3364652 RepID=UPI0036C88403
MAPSPAPLTEAELADRAEQDLPVLLRHGLTRPGPQRTALFGDGAVGAAVLLARLDVRPRAVAALAALVRAGGTQAAAALPEPLPGPRATALAQRWLTAADASGAGADVDADETTARWLTAVADIMGLRVAMGRQNPPGR